MINNELTQTYHANYAITYQMMTPTYRYQPKPVVKVVGRSREGRVYKMCNLAARAVGLSGPLSRAAWLTLTASPNHKELCRRLAIASAERLITKDASTVVTFRRRCNFHTTRLPAHSTTIHDHRYVIHQSALPVYTYERHISKKRQVIQRHSAIKFNSSLRESGHHRMPHEQEAPPSDASQPTDQQSTTAGANDHRSPADERLFMTNQPAAAGKKPSRSKAFSPDNIWPTTICLHRIHRPLQDKQTDRWPNDPWTTLPDPMDNRPRRPTSLNAVHCRRRHRWNHHSHLTSVCTFSLHLLSPSTNPANKNHNRRRTLTPPYAFSIL